MDWSSAFVASSSLVHSGNALWFGNKVRVRDVWLGKIVHSCDEDEDGRGDDDDDERDDEVGLGCGCGYATCGLLLLSSWW